MFFSRFFFKVFVKKRPFKKKKNFTFVGLWCRWHNKVPWWLSDGGFDERVSVDTKPRSQAASHENWTRSRTKNHLQATMKSDTWSNIMVLKPLLLRDGRHRLPGREVSLWEEHEGRLTLWTNHELCVFQLWRKEKARKEVGSHHLDNKTTADRRTREHFYTRRLYGGQKHQMNPYEWENTWMNQKQERKKSKNKDGVKMKRNPDWTPVELH